MGGRMDLSDQQEIAGVNGESITLNDMVSALGVADNLGFFNAFTRKVLIRQLAVREGIVVAPEDLQQKVDDWRYQHRLERVEDTEAWLSQRGIGLQDVAEEAEIQRLEYLLSVNVCDGKIDPFFVQHKLEFDEADVCWIFVQEESVAEELFLQISEEGADFYAFARRYSEDETTRPAGGYLGRLRRKQLPKGISPRVFALCPGNALGPEKISGGYAIYLLQQFYAAQLNDQVKKEIRKKLFHQWLGREMHKADIVFPLWQEMSGDVFKGVDDLSINKHK